MNNFKNMHEAFKKEEGTDDPGQARQARLISAHRSWLDWEMQLEKKKDKAMRAWMDELYSNTAAELGYQSPVDMHAFVRALMAKR